jgi:hypothetical protein
VSLGPPSLKSSTVRTCPLSIRAVVSKQPPTWKAVSSSFHSMAACLTSSALAMLEPWHLHHFS